jgi:hypothetical protein
MSCGNGIMFSVLGVGGTKGSGGLEISKFCGISRVTRRWSKLSNCVCY